MEGLELQLLTSNAALTRFERAAEIVLERQLGAVLERLNTDRGRAFAFVTNDEAMRLLGLSRATLARYRKDGTLAYHRLGGNVYYKLEDIETVLEARAVDIGQPLTHKPLKTKTPQGVATLERH